MSQTANVKSLVQPSPQNSSRRIEVSPAHAEKLLAAAESLPLYENQEFYSTELQRVVLDRVRNYCPDEFDGLTASIKARVAEWPYWIVISGLHFDDGNRLFVAINRAFGELVAPPYEKPRVQLVHYIQPVTDLKSARGGRESERLHTDTADWKVPVELISMACIRPDRGGGGRSRILDVDTLRDEIRNRLGEESLKLLETQPVPWQVASYCGGGIDWRPVLSKAGICWRRYTIDLAMDVEGALVSVDMLNLLEAFEEIVTATERTADFLMLESELLVSDNTRTIHARTPISADETSDRLMIRGWIRTS